MSEWVTVLGRLLSDRKLREQFLRDPRESARLHSIRSEDLDAFLSLPPGDLEAQSETLLRKRFSEVSRLLPATLSSLGASGWNLFQNYASTHWPASHARHREDASEFFQFLIRRKTSGLCRSEGNRLRFLRSGKRIGIHLVTDLLLRGHRRPALQILYRRRRSPRQIALFFSL